MVFVLASKLEMKRNSNVRTRGSFILLKSMVVSAVISGVTLSVGGLVLTRSNAT